MGKNREFIIRMLRPDFEVGSGWGGGFVNKIRAKHSGIKLSGENRELTARMLRPYSPEEKKPGFWGDPWGFRNRVSVVNTKVNGGSQKETGFLG